jgi:hypothetical protein
MTDATTPELSNAEHALLTVIDTWSGMYIPRSNTDSIAIASTLEEKSLVTIDRSHSDRLYVTLVHPSTPSPLPTLTVLPKPDPRASAWGNDTIHLNIPGHVLVNGVDCENAVEIPVAPSVKIESQDAFLARREMERPQREAKEQLVAMLMAAAKSIAAFERNGGDIYIPEQDLAWAVCDIVDAKDAEIADLKAENAALKKKIESLKGRLDLEEGFGEFMVGKNRREE